MHCRSFAQSNPRNNRARVQSIFTRVIAVRWNHRAAQVYLFLASLLTVLAGQAATFPVFGPELLQRTSGTPNRFEFRFDVPNTALPYTLHIYNGGLSDDTYEKVSSSVISLNGTQIVGPQEFNQNISTVEKSITPGSSNLLIIELRGKPGGAVAVLINGIDNLPPTVSALALPPANAAGWNQQPVTVTFTCHDNESGIATCPAAQTLTNDGANQRVTGTAVDRAGNTASAAVTINLDRTVPSLTLDAVPAPNAQGWRRQDVELTFTCTDALSGIAVCPPSRTVTTEGEQQPVSGEAIDRAGNRQAATLLLNIDKTAPTLDPAFAPPANDAGWSNRDTTVTYRCQDGLSGINTCPPTHLISNEGVHTLTPQATDRAGNATQTNVTVKLDKTAPILEVTSPAADEVTRLPTQRVAGAAQDTLSGVSVTVNDLPAPIDLNHQYQIDLNLTKGANLVQVTAEDGADNTRLINRTVTYQTTPPDTTPPTVSPAYPGAGFVASGIITLAATAQDSSGIQNVAYAIDGIARGSVASSPYTLAFDTTSVNNGSHTLTVTARDSAGNVASSGPVTFTVENTAPPAAPVASPINPTVPTPLQDAIAFLYSGPNAVQVGAQASTFVPTRSSVVRGRLLTRNGQAVAGARVDVLAHPEYGHTLTRADGQYDLVVNGGGVLTLNYNKAGYLPVQR